MTEATQSAPGDIPPPKRRKVEDADPTSSPVSSKIPRKPLVTAHINGDASYPPASGADPQQQSHHSSSSSHPNNENTNHQHSTPPADPTTVLDPPTGLAPEVDAVLIKIFASGLFDRKDIDGRALDFLASVPSNLAMAALEDIQRRDFSTVRNKPAFIMSIFKRVVTSSGPSGPPYPATTIPPSALAHLPPAVSEALQRVFQSGVCHPSQFDDRAMDHLVDLQQSDAVRALSEFAAMEPGRVRNPSAFWMGLARKVKNQSRSSSRIATPYDPSASGYSNYEPSHYDSRRMSSVATPVSPAVLDQRLDELAASGHLPRNVLDERALDALRRLSEQDALGVLAEIPEPSRVRNMSAYVMGLCKKFANGEARSLSHRSSYGTSAYSASTYPTYGATSHYGAQSYSGYGGYNGSAYGGTSGGALSSGQSGYGSGSYGNPSGGGDAGSSYGAQTSLDASRQAEVRDALNSMDPSVRNRYYQLIEQGTITETSFDVRAITALQNMQREEACLALDELAASEPGRIHNISAYFMGLAKKFGRPSV